MSGSTTPRLKDHQFVLIFMSRELVDSRHTRIKVVLDSRHASVPGGISRKEQLSRGTADQRTGDRSLYADGLEYHERDRLCDGNWSWSSIFSLRF